MMRWAVLCLSLGLFSCGAATNSTLSYSDDEAFPRNPQSQLTPGSLCADADEYRYPDRVPYCDRDVASSLKKEIIDDYDRILGFHIGEMDRKDFKIDHYIPLSVGGSNKRDNLWPQHKSVYVLTDPIEEKLFRLLQRGKLSQARVVEKMRHVKNHLDEAHKMDAELDEMLQ